MLTRPGQWVIVFVHLPQCDPFAGGVLLLDETTDSLAVKLLTSLPIDDEALTLLWNDLGDDLVRRSAAAGGEAILAWLEDTASHSIRIGTREEIALVDSSTAVEELFQKHVVQRRGQAAGRPG